MTKQIKHLTIIVLATLLLLLAAASARNSSDGTAELATRSVAGGRTLQQTNPELPRHKRLAPVNSLDIGMFVAAAVALFIAAGAGIGAGPALVPIYISLGQFVQTAAVALSNSTILAGALASVLCTAGKRHPVKNKPLVDWDLILLMEPPTLLGAIVGSYLNKLVPAFVCHVLLAMLLTFMTYRVMQRARSIFKQETAARLNAAKTNKATAAAAAAAMAEEPNATGTACQAATESEQGVGGSTAGGKSKAGDSMGGADVVVELAELGEPATGSGHGGCCSGNGNDTGNSSSHLVNLGHPLEAEQGRAQGPVRQDCKLLEEPAVHDDRRDGSTDTSSAGPCRVVSVLPATGTTSDTAAVAAASSSSSSNSNSSSSSLGADGATTSTANDSTQHLHHRTNTHSKSTKQAPEAASAAAVAAVEGVLRAEAAQLPLFPLMLLTLLFLAVLLTSLFSKNAGCGTLAYWLVQWSVAPVLFGVWWISRRHILRKVALKRDAMVCFNGEVRWTSRNSITFPMICTGAGVIAGMFGLGGAVVKTPLMLELGVHPQVTAATTQAMMLLTAGASTIVYAQLGDIPWDYAAIILPLSFCVTLAGQLAIDWLVHKLGRSSVVVQVLVGFFVVSACLTYFITIVSLVDLIHHQKGAMALGNICEPPVLD